ncbi:MAG: hypothetical protein IPM23_25450 [Candidatus Melainabacteria bacterium]|nr:hypothetical protein [Candidatus Melainabacteria bacterium]
MKRLFLATLVLSSIAVGGCGQAGSAADPARGAAQGGAGQGMGGVLGKLRPKADPGMVAQLKEDEIRAQQEQMRQAQEALAKQQGGSSDVTDLSGFGSILPKVSTEPISAPPAESIANQPLLTALNPFAPAAANIGAGGATLDTTSLAPAEDTTPVVDAPPQAQVASYNPYYTPTSVPPPPPGAIAGGLVPPPPAVTLSTQAAVGDSGAYPNPYANSYGNPYANPYLNPYAIPYQPAPQMPAIQQPPPQRPSGLFGNNSSGRGQEDREEDDERRSERKKEVDFVPIRPTGMPSRSPYKQREDLKVLWDGSLSSYAFEDVLNQDGNLLPILKRVNVGLPPDATRGMFTVPPRTVAAVFRPMRINKKVDGQVAKLQHDLVQAYYRYLYTYNKFALSQQTVAARKQEVEVAGSRSEKQRAAADMASAQNEAESAREDMKAAQYELAAVAGANAARTIIGRVSGVTPSIGTLAQAEKSAQPVEPEGGSHNGVLGSMGKIFFGNRGGSSRSEAAAEDEKPARVAEKKMAEKSAEKPKAKKGKHLLGKSDKGEDLAPSPGPTATARHTDPVVPRDAGSTEKAASGPISFELKNVDITARKSILSVAIRNTGSENFKLSADDVSISEGNRKISEAAMRAEFDSALVKPNQEVKGKITIFGRPWNDRLVVNITNGTSNIQLKRRSN